MEKSFLRNSNSIGKNDVNFRLPEDIQEEGIISNILSFKESQRKVILSYILYVLTGGILYLFTRWNIDLKIKLQMVPCHQNDAQYMKVLSSDNIVTLEKTFKSAMCIEKTSAKEYLVNRNNSHLTKTYFFLLAMTTRFLNANHWAIYFIFLPNIVYSFTLLTFTYRLYKYYLDESTNTFLPIQFALSLLSNNEIHERYGNGVENEGDLTKLQSIYGDNNTEIPDKSSIKILIDDVLSPFYIFQIFSVVIWVLEPYYYYAGVIFITSVLSATTSLIEAKNNYKKLRQMSFFETPVFTYRGISEYLSKDRGQLKIEEDIIKGRQKISSLYLVPGDIIEIPDGQILPCDVILLNGSCVMNESMLTGESIPIIKSSLPYNNNKYNPNEEGKQSTLFAGTKCIETRYYLKGKVPVIGLVSQTSFNTMKGQLVRSILYPKSNSFSFYTDSLRFIAVLAVISLFGFFVALPFMIQGLDNGFLEVRDLVLNSFDLVTITVPPALPTCLSIGISFALSRMKKKQIFCISPPKVNICGKVTIMCFDKTGTLTEEGLDMYGLRPVFYSGPQKVKFAKLQEETKLLGVTKQIKQNGKAEHEDKYGVENPYTFIGDPEIILKECMASCHGITRVNGELIGDPLEVKMFEATEWVLIENDIDKYDELVLAVVQPQQIKMFEEEVKEIDENIINHNLPTSIGIIKRFEFSSKLQRMSTIVRNLQNENEFYRLHVKGSPEKIYELCSPSTIPHNFHEVLDFYARKGFRVLAFGVKVLKMNYRQVQKVERDEIEKDLTFVGLLIMENKLKPITTSIIQLLQSANIRTIMVTGDNALTAISVGRQCQIVDENKRVYFGDISEETSGPKKGKIVWKDFELGNKVLDEDLKPVGGVAEYHEEGIMEIQEEKQIMEIAHQIEEQERLSIEQGDVRLSRKSYIDQAKKSLIGIHYENLLTNYFYLEHQRQSQNIKDKAESNSHCIPIKNEVDVNQENENAEEVLPWNNNDHFSLAITGKAFSKIINEASLGQKQEQLLRTMLLKAQIFARMRPEEKALLLQSLQNLPWKPTCGMCGDGANDCGALKSADIGISLSEAEASIAAPFTSKIQNISCVIDLLKEGRSALVTSFSCFKFMALYSMIQFFSTTLLYTVNSLPGDFQFLYWDVVIIIPLAFLMGLTESYEKLSKQVPGSSLVSFPVLCSVIGQTILNGGIQTIVFFVLKAQSWYRSVQQVHEYLDDINKENARKRCFESTTLFFFTNFQYISVCLAFSIGKPFKQNFYTNKWFTGALVIIVAVSLYVMLIPDSFTKDFLSILENVQRDGDTSSYTSMPYSWLIVLLGFGIGSFIASICFEKFVVRKLSLIYSNMKEKKNGRRKSTLAENYQSVVH